MRSIYARFVAVTLAVMVISSFLGFFLSNIYYQVKLKPVNDEKVTQVAKRVAAYYQQNSALDLSSYLEQIGDTGYQLMLVNQTGEKRFFGGDFRVKTIDAAVVERVRAGEIYHGIDEFKRGFFVTGFFDNHLKNSIGVPIETKDGRMALFVRPNQEAQFGELRIFFALILVLTAVISVILVFISTRMVAKPITKLTAATEKIAAGDFNVKLNTKRQDEIGQLGASFAKMTKELEALEASRQEFVANVSHELQSPLTSIHGFAELLLKDQLTKAERTEYLELLVRETGRLSGLTKQLLLLAFLDKEEEGQFGEKTAEPAAGIRNAVRMLAFRIQEKDLSVMMELTDDRVIGDPELVDQVWQNLVSNAVKYTPEGGSIRITSAPEAGAVKVSIWNSGAGIPAAQIDKIFDRFYRLDSARSRGEGSSGLGLSIVQKIVKLFHGTVTAESDPEAGTMFTVWLKKADL
ncbi:sensor histidine kinase [Listeria floridensis]|nr:HAMP domain-containing sensor histidine kinase [Listeria floridensis]